MGTFLWALAAQSLQGLKCLPNDNDYRGQNIKSQTQ